MTTDERPGGGRGPRPVAGRPPLEPTATILELSGQLDRTDLPAFREQARAAIGRSEADQVVCDLGRLGRPDAATVEALAWVQLEARRLGRRVVFRDACGELRDLVAFVGLDEALPCEDG